MKDSRPFTTALRMLHAAGWTYEEMSRRCNSAPHTSTAWLNKQVNSRHPWLQTPPPAAALAAYARLFGTTEARIAEWIALEWYGVDGARLTPTARAVADLVDSLDPDTLEDLLAAVTSALFPPASGSAA